MFLSSYQAISDLTSSVTAIETIFSEQSNMNYGMPTIVVTDVKP